MPIYASTPSRYVDNLARRSKIARKGILPPPLKIILNTYYPLSSQPQQPPQPSPQCDVPPRRPSAQSPPQQQCSVPRVVTPEETTVERSAKKVTPLDVCVCMDERTEAKMEPERRQLESLSAGLVRVLEHLDSSVSQVGRCNKLLSKAFHPSTGVWTWGKTLFLSKTSLFGCNPITEH